MVSDTELSDEFVEILWSLPVKILNALLHLQAVPDRPADGVVHLREQGHRGDPEARPRVDLFVVTVRFSPVDSSRTTETHNFPRKCEFLRLAVKRRNLLVTAASHLSTGGVVDKRDCATKL